jgi:outer membrane protein TolC
MNRTATLSRRGVRAASALAGFLAFGLLSSLSEAQPAPRRPPAPAAAQPAPAPAAPAAPAQPAAAAPAQPGAAAAPAPPERGPDPLAVALAPKPGGLTPEEVGKAAAKANASLRSKQAELQAASAKVDQALVNFFPRLTVAATYTRLSEVELPPELASSPVGALFTPPAPNTYSLTANLIVPISDYVLRISQGYAAASHAESAKKLEVQAAQLQVVGDAKVAFYNWVQAKGQVVVAHEAVEQARAHVADARRTFEVGLISRADVLRLEAQVAGAEQVEAQATAFQAIAEEQLRIALGAPPDKTLEIGIDVMGEPPPPPSASLQAFQNEALQKRLEIRALDETVYSLKEAESIARAGYYPRLDAFADLNYAKPNQRYTFEPDEFKLSWDAGIRLSWTINDTFTAIGASAEAKARTQSLMEQKAALRDGLRLEVASAYADVQKSASTIAAAERQLAAAEESMRVRGELFRAGRATSVDVVDAETEVTRARLAQVSARVGLLVARTRLEHATGRDVK